MEHGVTRAWRSRDTAWDCLPFARDPGACDLCGAPLGARQHRWCSLECGDLYWTNHRWNRARGRALSRSRMGAGRYRCGRCGCGTRDPEVNHRTPAMGAHSRESCAHHQENLEVLCRDCHLTETRRQHAANEFGRRRSPRLQQTPLDFGGAA